MGGVWWRVEVGKVRKMGFQTFLKRSRWHWEENCLGDYSGVLNIRILPIVDGRDWGEDFWEEGVVTKSDIDFRWFVGVKKFVSSESGSEGSCSVDQERWPYFNFNLFKSLKWMPVELTKCEFACVYADTQILWTFCVHEVWPMTTITRTAESKLF